MILVVAIAVTAVFYSHLEVGMGRQIKGFRSVLAWIHLVGMNGGGAATTIIMMFAGLAGSGVLGIIVGGSDTLQENTAINGSIHRSNCDIYGGAEHRSNFRGTGIRHVVLEEASI
jgi:hypothetical protein